MLTKIEITNYKLFDEKVLIPLSNLNIFTGINGRGKSTAQQTLILMKQSLENGKIDNIKFHGSYLKLGSFDDIKATDKEITFTFFEDSNFISYEFAAADVNALKSQTCNISMSPSDFHIDFDKVNYISAERLSPQFDYQKNTDNYSNGVGKNGEFAVSILLEKNEEYDLIFNNLLLDIETTTTTIIDQTGAWISKIFGGGNVNIKSLSATLLEMSFTGHNSKTKKDIKPTNIGYGYSNVLPLIVAGLIAREGDILIIDSPEAHLHPSAQSELAKFLAKVAQNGVQIFIETHSEHVLNGIRIAINTGEFTSSNVSLLYFQDNVVERIKHIEIDSKGGIDEWPSGFFDQYEKDLSKLYSM